MDTNQKLAHGRISFSIIVLVATTALMSCNRDGTQEPITPERDPCADERGIQQMVDTSTTYIPGTQMTYDQTGDGAEISFTTSRDVDQIRLRAKRIAELHDRMMNAQAHRGRTVTRPEPESRDKGGDYTPTETCYTAEQCVIAICPSFCSSCSTIRPPESTALLRILPSELTVDALPQGARIRFTLPDDDLRSQRAADYAAYLIHLMLVPALPDLDTSAIPEPARGEPTKLPSGK